MSLPFANRIGPDDFAWLFGSGPPVEGCRPLIPLIV